MALKGTLKDFGIADILQLIGQQQKTGALHLKSKDQEVHVVFKEGNIVKAETSTRKRKDLIGNMLVRAELITEQQLEVALETQRRTLKRLGDVLVSTKMLSAQQFKQMMQLQATETLYGLFAWKSGTYEFEQRDVDDDPDAIAPLRAESVLMEGFRIVDEWPVIKKVISRFDITFEKTKELPAQAESADAFDEALDDAFAEKKKEENKGEFKSIADSERKTYGLITPNRDVRRLVDLSCLGEFETCKALCNLVNLEYLKPIVPQGRTRSAESGGFLDRATGWAGRVLLTACVCAALVLVVSRIDLDAIRLTSAPSSSYADPAAQRFIARSQMRRISAALELYRLENDGLPDTLDRLVDTGLLAKEDTRYPWRDPYYYRRTAGKQFILLPPLR